MENTFSPTDMQAFQPAMKIGLLATLNPQGLPHLSLITSLKASSPRQVCWGQFTEGFSKDHVRQNPRTAFLIMTLDKRMWRGKAAWTHTARSGPEFEFYNNVPMFRYNAYFGIHTVHYMDLICQTGCTALPMSRVVTAALLGAAARRVIPRSRQQPVINAWTAGLFNGLSNLKFLAYVDPADGWPEIIPVIQAQAIDRRCILISHAAYGNELARIPKGAQVALFGMTLAMEDVVVRGELTGTRSAAGFPFSLVEVGWVYNSMPPTPQQIYPPIPFEPIRQFDRP